MMLSSVPATPAGTAMSNGLVTVEIASAFSGHTAKSAQAASASAVTETNGVASIDVMIGNEINAAVDALTDYLANNATATSGVVNVTQSTTFSDTITLDDNIILNIQSGVTLTLDTQLGDFDPAVNTSFTTNSGVVGSGTIDIGNHYVTY